MTQQELNNKYSDIQEYINYYWNSLREMMGELNCPIFNLHSIGQFEINKKLVYVSTLKLLEACKKNKKDGDKLLFARNFNKLKKLRSIQHKNNVINYVKNFEINLK